MPTLRKLVPGEHKVIGDIIADSFADDPVNQWVFGGQSGMLQHYTHVARKLYLHQGYGHVTDDLNGGTLWLPPGKKADIPFYKSLDIAYSMLRHCGLKSISRGIAIDDFLANKKPQQPHHYLFAIGTRPNHQGTGIGGTLMRAGLERANLDGMPAYLESSKEINVPFYQKFGFEVIEKVIPPKGCPPLWLMWREASLN